MDIEEYKRIIADQNKALIKRLEGHIIKRDIPDLNKFIKVPNVLAILGVRRCGKSTVSALLMRNRKFGYVNFDDERLYNIPTSDLNKLLQAIYELAGVEVEFLLFDEIQNVEAWELFVSRLRDTKRIIITGSSSQLLSSELATHLTGRHIDFGLFPFSFIEFIKYKSMGLDKNNVYTTSDIAKIRSGLNSFIDIGGFPEAAIIGKEILLAIYSDIIQKDAIVRFRIKNIIGFKEVALYLLSNIANEFSYAKLKNVTNIKDVHTIKNYVGYLATTYLIIVIDRFSYKLKERFLSPKKVYCIDHGMAKFLVGNISISRIIENIVAVEILRRIKIKDSTEKLFYWRNYSQKEVDFVISKGNIVKQLMQVIYASERPEIRENEIKGLLVASEELNCNNLIVVTWNYEAEEKIGAKKIKFVPIWKWLLKLID